ncbi:hypothetical protein IPU75_08375 [Ochrobactrum sp. SD129]|nr:hypothetical protein [Ochrobactrum sp. SD129]
MLEYDENRFKYIFAHSFFAKPADTNYLLARYTKINFMFSEFYWQSAQAIEKYLKAGLILNGHSVKKLSHNLNSIWKIYKSVYNECPVPEFEKPENLRGDLWDRCTLDEFINRINKYGDIDCRYGLVSYHTFPYDLFKLDYLIFQLKRRVVGINWFVGRDLQDDHKYIEFYGRKYLELIMEQKDYMPSKFEPLKTENFGTALDKKDAYYHWNFSLSQEGNSFPPAPHSISSSMGHLHNTALQILYNSISKTKNNKGNISKIKWILRNVKLKDEDIILIAEESGLEASEFTSRNYRNNK